ncbi:MAG TPA: C4-type zinc ribbon domain-containing protein [Acidobacteriota bacterium]|nr:C4-type zinc ribbon domain-containing protein [Acidobacteriota bacterium]
MNADLRNLIALQDLEMKIANIQKQISDTPLNIQGFRGELNRIKQAHAERVAHAQELTKQRRTLEGEVDMMRTKLSKLKDQLMSVKTNKEYTAMLHEIQMAEDRIRSEEDKILVIMEEMESKEQDLKGAEKALKATTLMLEEKIRVCENAVPGLEAERARLHEERRAMEAHVETELLARYRRIAEARKGIALAEAKDELCTACHVRIRPQVYADLLRTESIHACDSCSRILFSREGL